MDRGVVTVVDPHGKFESANIEILQQTAYNLIVKGEIVLKNTMAPTNFLFYAIDLDRNSGEFLVSNALEVVEQSIVLADEQNEITKTMNSEKLTEIPIWVKSNAHWWKQQQIDDSDFIAGIEYLIQKAIIEINNDKNSNQVASNDIPDWVRDVAGYWAIDYITDDEFIHAMQWLINNGMLQVKT